MGHHVSPSDCNHAPRRRSPKPPSVLSCVDPIDKQQKPSCRRLLCRDTKQAPNKLPHALCPNTLLYRKNTADARTTTPEGVRTMFCTWKHHRKLYCTLLYVLYPRRTRQRSTLARAGAHGLARMTEIVLLRLSCSQSGAPARAGVLRWRIGARWRAKL